MKPTALASLNGLHPAGVTRARFRAAPGPARPSPFLRLLDHELHAAGLHCDFARLIRRPGVASRQAERSGVSSCGGTAHLAQGERVQRVEIMGRFDGTENRLRSQTDLFRDLWRPSGAQGHGRVTFYRVGKLPHP